MKTLGIVAGAGPFAGVDLLQKVFLHTDASTDQEHLQVLALFDSPNLPDRTDFLLDPTLPNPGKALAQQLQTLEEMGANIAAIPCNTAHAPRILECAEAALAAAGVKLQFINMIAETAQFIRRTQPNLSTVGVLSTTGTTRAGIYPLYLEDVGITTVLPDENFQTKVIHPAIYDPEYGIKAAGTAAERARTDLKSGIAHLASKGAQAVILGCTEIPLAIPEANMHGIALIDPTTILARALIREAAPEKLKPLGA